jgi:hypothetical protein
MTAEPASSRSRHGPGQGCTDQLRRELPGLIAKVKPAKLGWFPSGPAPRWPPT